MSGGPLRSIRYFALAQAAIVLGAMCPTVHAQCLPTEGDVFALNAGMIGDKRDAAVPISLEHAIRRGLQRDPRISQSWAEVSARSASVQVARAAYLPSATAAADVSMTSDASTMPGGVVGPVGAEAGGSWQVGVSWLLFDLGERDALVDRAKYRLEIAGALADASLQQVILDVAKAYHFTRDAYARLRIAHDIERSSGQIVEAACAKFDAGAGALVDVLRARTVYDKYVLLRLEASADVVARSGRLASLIGEPLGAVFALDDEASRDIHLYTVPPLASIEALMSDLERHHPLLRKASAEIHTENAAWDAARLAWGPTLSLVADVGRAMSVGKYADFRPGTRASVGIQIRIPIFDGGIRKARMREAGARADLAVERRRAVVREVTSRIWQSHRALLALSRRRSVEVRLSDDARQAYDIARERYREGVGSIEEIMSAQTALVEAQETLRLSRARWRLARLALAASLGQLDITAGRKLALPRNIAPITALTPPTSPPQLYPETGTDEHRPSRRR